MLVFLSASAHAGTLVSEGQTGAAFLQIPVSARTMALGDTFAGGFGDSASLQYNPAGLVGQVRPKLEFGYQKYFQDDSLQSLTLGFPSKSPFGKNAEGSPYIPPDQLYWAFQYKRFSANDTARNELGAAQNDFAIKDQLTKIGLGFAPFEKVAFGVSGGLISRTIDNQSASGWEADAGMLVFLNERFTIGVSALNMGPSETFVTESDPLPTTLKAGLRWQMLRVLTLYTDIAGERDKTTRESAGMEFQIAGPVKLRFGASHQTTWEGAGGIGIMIQPPAAAPLPSLKEDSVQPKTSNRNTLENLDSKSGSASQRTPATPFSSMAFGLDYAFRSQPDLGLTQTITVSLHF